MKTKHENQSKLLRREIKIKIQVKGINYNGKNENDKRNMGFTNKICQVYYLNWQ